MIRDNGPCVESWVNRRITSSIDAQVWFMAVITISLRRSEARRTDRPERS